MTLARRLRSSATVHPTLYDAASRVRGVTGVSMSPSSFRRGRIVVIAIVAVISAGAVVGALLSDLSPFEKLLGVVFYLGLFLAAFGVWQSLSRPAAGRRWAPRHFTGRHQDHPVTGVAFPVRVADKGALSYGMVLLGAALLAGAGYVALTGKGVDGGTGTRVVAVVLSVLFGVVLLAGGVAVRRSARAAARSVVLAPDALYVPGTAGGSRLPWEQITGFRRKVKNRAVPAGDAAASRYLRNDEVIDVLGSNDHRLAKITVTHVPEPEQLLRALTAVHLDASLRESLATPSTADRFAAR